jgi:ATP-dependent Clp protease ATP-binding subunit ClpA
MPSSRDRRRLEVPVYIHDRLQQIAASESRTVASVATELLHFALDDRRATWMPDHHLPLLNERARHVLDLAQDEARDHRHNYLGTEHLLLGLLREDQGAAASFLSGRGIRLDPVRSLVARIVGRGRERESLTVELTPRGRRVLALAVEQAQAHGHERVGTEHILLGLALEAKGLAMTILTHLGLDAEQIRQRDPASLSQDD